MVNSGGGGTSVGRRNGGKQARVAAVRTERIDQIDRLSQLDPERFCRGSSRRADARLPTEDEGWHSHVSLPDAVSHGTVEVLDQLIEGARAGKVIGFGVVPMLKRPRYFVNTATDCRTDPTLHPRHGARPILR